MSIENIEANAMTKNRQMNKMAHGFTLIELLIAITVLGALIAIAVPMFSSYRDQQKISVAISDLRVLDNQIKSYQLSNDKLPAGLSNLPQISPADPWGGQYQYLNIVDADTKAKSQVRKDKNLVPINSDFDLYSMGADGKTTPPLTGMDSQDDIVRANDGGYYGLASKY